MAKVYERECAAAFLKTLKAQKTIMAGLVGRYVTEELQLQWDWLMMDLHRIWLWDLLGWIFDRPQQWHVIYVPEEPPAPLDIEYRFKPHPGESYPDMLARFKAETGLFQKEHQTTYQKLKGKLYSNQDVERYVEWFFRKHITQEKIERIAEYEMDGATKRAAPFDRKDVRTYSALAEEWLRYGFTRDNLRNGPEIGSDDPRLSPLELDGGVDS